MRWTDIREGYFRQINWERFFSCRGTTFFRLSLTPWCVWMLLLFGAPFPGTATTANAQSVDPLLLVYRIAGDSRLHTDTTNLNAPVGGSLVLDRFNQRAGFVWKIGKTKQYYTEIRNDVATHSTALASKSETLVAGDAHNGTYPDEEHAMVWLRGLDAVTRFSASDSVTAPLSMAGFVSQLQIKGGLLIETRNVSLVLDKARSATCRLNEETLEAALSRLGKELEQNGYVLIQSTTPFAPSIAGWYHSDGNGITLKIDQVGDHITSTFSSPTPMYNHVLTGTWEKDRFKDEIVRTNILSSCTTVMKEEIVNITPTQFTTIVTSTDGNCDLPVDFHEELIWKKLP